MCEALREIMADDLKEAEARGTEKTNALYMWLYEFGRGDEVKKAICDPVFLDKLFEEYNSCH